MSASTASDFAQWTVVAAIVAGCAVYAFWQLAPKAVLRRCAGLLAQRAPFLAAWQPVRTALRVPVASSCACNGCDKGTGRAGSAAQAGSSQVIRIVPRRPPSG